MSIADVIAAASREGAGFSEVKTFTLARNRAIEKMRKFALADPYFYILELIQAAVANDAEYIAISAGDGNLTLSYIGGHIGREQLAQLFDFLFASKERIDLAHVRSLALGVNAALNFKPERVIIESGDGTAEGTSRMVMHGGAEVVDVGQADRAMAGTFVRFEGLRRGPKARTMGSNALQGGGREFAVIEGRCLTAPVPIIFNGHSMFGFSTQRIPSLLGYRRRLEFDEGDLYGVLGLDPTGGEPGFALLTHGVWVQSYEAPELVPGSRLGGIVVFDRLRKTADHSGFVHDERFKEMWIRLRPYARRLVSGKQGRQHLLKAADGSALSAADLREMADRTTFLVVTRCEDFEGLGVCELAAYRRRAKAIAHALGAELLEVDGDTLPAVLSLVRDRTRAVVPSLEDDTDVDFYSQSLASPPDKPWLSAPFKMRTRSVAELAEQLVRYAQLPPAAPGDKEDPLVALQTGVEERLGVLGDVSITVYTPAEAELAAEGLVVRVWTSGRELYAGAFESSFAGHEVLVELPDAPPAELRADALPGVSGTLAELVAAEIAVEVPLALAAVGRKTLESLSVGEVRPGEIGARLALSILTRHCVARLRSTRADSLRPGLAISAVTALDGFDPLGLSVLQTLDGRALSLRELGGLMDLCSGIAYGVCEGVVPDLEGLDRSRILKLSPHEERLLIVLVGEANYVRVDGREVLARVATPDGDVVVRDVAMGLLPYSGPQALLTEGPPLAPEMRRRIDLELVAQLVAYARGEEVVEAETGWEREERRRQCIRHLQWYCATMAVLDRRALFASPAASVPLFLDRAGAAHTMRAVLQALKAGPPMSVALERSLGELDLAQLTANAESDALPTDLRVSGLTFRLLQPLGQLRLAFDFDLDAVEAAANPATPDAPFLARAEIARPSLGIRGVLGVPTRAPKAFLVQIIDGNGRVAVHHELAEAYGICGTVQLDGEMSTETADALAGELEKAGELCLERLLLDLAERETGGELYQASVAVLLRYAGRHLTLVAGPQVPSVVVGRPLAEQVLAAPLFPGRRGMPLSARRIAEIYCQRVEVDQHAKPWRALLSDGLDASLENWLASHLCPSRISRPASRGRRAVASLEPQDLPLLGADLEAADLAANAQLWLARLRPESWGKGLTVLPGSYEGDGPGSLEGRVYFLDPRHWLCRRVSAAEPQDRAQAFAWLLLAIYAVFNAVHDPVTNEHELEFQCAVGAALADGSLVLFDIRQAELVG